MPGCPTFGTGIMASARPGPPRPRVGPAEASARALGEVGVDGVEVGLDVRIAGEAAHDAARARGALQHRRGEALAARQRLDQGRREARARAVRTVAVAAHALVPASNPRARKPGRARARPSPPRPDGAAAEAARRTGAGRSAGTPHRCGRAAVDGIRPTGTRRSGWVPRISMVRRSDRPRGPRTPLRPASPSSLRHRRGYRLGTFRIEPHPRTFHSRQPVTFLTDKGVPKCWVRLGAPPKGRTPARPGAAPSDRKAPRSTYRPAAGSRPGWRPAPGCGERT